MISGKTSSVVRQLDVLWTSGSLTGMSDAQLLGRFAEARDSGAELAFRELINRHGSMVMGVCRQILRHSHDADDAFQATFLVLVRKARSIRVGDSLAPWLYGVAYRTALRARSIASRYRSAAVEQLEEPMEPTRELAGHFDMRPLLHEELNRLPGKYREPIVLCHLEGKSHEEAARLLHWPVGTVSGRLSRGRELLRTRLERRGLAVPSALLSAAWSNADVVVPASLVESTLTIATSFAAQSASASVLSLTQGVLRAMLLNRLKTVSIALLIAVGISGGAGVWARWPSGSLGPTPQSDKTDPKAVPKALIPSNQQRPVVSSNPFGSGPARVPNDVAANPFPKKSLPNMADFRDPIPAFGLGSILLVESPDGRTLQAKSVDVDNPAWQPLEIPSDVKTTPLATNDVLALAYAGKSIDQLAAFSARHGKWSKIRLVKPVQEAITPVLGPGSALYQAGNVFYAFSAEKGVWDVLQLPADDPAEPRASASSSSIQVQHSNRLYVFSTKHGKWSEGATMKLRSAPGKPAATKRGSGTPE